MRQALQKAVSLTLRTSSSYRELLPICEYPLFARKMSTEKQVETIKVEQQEAVKVITLNRPEKLNALSTQCCDELLQSLKAADDDANTHVSIITGSGRVLVLLTSLPPD